jgi:hypothetical protein
MNVSRSAVFALVACTALFVTAPTYAEEAGAPADPDVEHADEQEYRRAIGAWVGGTNEHGETGFTFGVEYVHAIIPEKFDVGGLVERTGSPIEATVGLGFVHYHFFGPLYVTGGVGVEHKHGKNESVIRIGVGYHLKFGRLLIAPEINLDTLDREEALVIGVGVGWEF